MVGTAFRKMHNHFGGLLSHPGHTLSHKKSARKIIPLSDIVTITVERGRMHQPLPEPWRAGCRLACQVMHTDTFECTLYASASAVLDGGSLECAVDFRI